MSLPLNGETALQEDEFLKKIEKQLIPAHTIKGTGRLAQI